MRLLFARHGKSFNDMKNRFVPFIEGLVSRAVDILLVCHGAVLYQMLPLVQSNIEPGFIQAHPLGY